MSLFVAMKLLIVASTVLLVIALSLFARLQDVFHFIRNPALGLRAFLAMYIIVPAVALLFIVLFDLRPGVELALLVISLSPVPPRLPSKQHKSGAENAYVTGLLVTSALVSLIVMPLGLHLIGSWFARDIEVSSAGIAKTLAITVVIPLIIGLVAQKVLGERSERVARVMAKLSMVMLVIGVLVVFVMIAPGMWALVGHGTLIALAAMVVIGLLAGYALGGPLPGNRSALALATSMRHPGVALGVIATAFPDAHPPLMAIIIFTLLNVIISIPFLKLVQRHRSAP